MFYLIYAIVPSGRAGKVIHAAEAAGSLGGTIIHGKGIGRKPKRFLYFEVEPMRDVIWIIVEESRYREVSQSIYDELELEGEGQGILFVEPLDEVHGLVDQLSE
ncbi:P-II family nitrogen regulator [Fundicoccus culcitae]|uniref:P-II family nitrogen regulator n=1 Tax=Fundicoccus culcitae TaxID=2969821 RepID=A0ABY5P7R7_9LACT|nr:P-II family nitrogen regulator [Fundicoccus culcitae]UUX34699.1 hypothetical protein NRE15_03345 [Fundicoccus culcitae]